MTKKDEGICDMCGNYVLYRENAHIIEGENNKDNILELCPSCHHMFDHHLKLKLFNAIKNTKYQLPKLWEKDPYQQAAEESMKAREKKQS